MSFSFCFVNLYELSVRESLILRPPDFKISGIPLLYLWVTQNHRNLEPEGTRNLFSPALSEVEPVRGLQPINCLPLIYQRNPNFVQLWRWPLPCPTKGIMICLTQSVTTFSFARDCFRGRHATQFWLQTRCFSGPLGRDPEEVPCFPFLTLAADIYPWDCCSHLA